MEPKHRGSANWEKTFLQMVFNPSRTDLLALNIGGAIIVIALVLVLTVDFTTSPL